MYSKVGDTCTPEARHTYYIIHFTISMSHHLRVSSAELLEAGMTAIHFYLVNISSQRNSVI